MMVPVEHRVCTACDLHALLEVDVDVASLPSTTSRTTSTTTNDMTQIEPSLAGTSLLGALHIPFVMLTIAPPLA
jgi:hypothetical protein